MERQVGLIITDIVPRLLIRQPRSFLLVFIVVILGLCPAARFIWSCLFLSWKKQQTETTKPARWRALTNIHYINTSIINSDGPSPKYFPMLASTTLSEMAHSNSIQVSSATRYGLPIFEIKFTLRIRKKELLSIFQKWSLHQLSTFSSIYLPDVQQRSKTSRLIQTLSP